MDKNNTVSEKISDVKCRLRSAAERSGRDPETIRLVCVSKTATTEQIKEAHDCGLKDFGENRVQSAEKKIS